MSPLAHRRFAKMNGLGNEIVTLDLRGTDAEVSAVEASAIAAAKDLAYDQLMVLHDPRAPGSAAFMRIYNNDGTESAACGNGTRCVAFWLTRGTDARRLSLETSAGPLDCVRESNMRFTVDMGPPRLDWAGIPLRDPVPDTRAVTLPSPDLPQAFRVFAAVNMGNPHAVFFVDEIAAHDLARLGPRLETDPIFPQRANISLAHVVARDHIVLRVWERGVGLTLACGTAACATLVAAARKDLSARKARVTLPGGDLLIDWRAADDHVLMTGPVEFEFEGELDPGIFDGAAA